MTSQIAEFSEWESAKSSMPIWLEKLFPWMVSFTMHAGCMLLIVGLFYLAKDVRQKYYPGNGAQLDFPNSSDGLLLDAEKPMGSPNPGVVNDTSEAAQDKFKDSTDGWAETDTASKMNTSFSGEASGDLTNFIARGAGGVFTPSAGSIGRGDGGRLAPYGLRGGGSGPGPKGLFCNCYNAPGATRVVYVLDHSGSMICTFDFVREEIKKSVNSLTPNQAFSVIMFSEKVDVVFPKEGGMEKATPQAKRDLKDFVDNTRAAGKNDDLYVPFADGLQKALALKPAVIYFLTDGNFDPRLVDEVRRLNTNKCKINTLAFLDVSREAEVALKTIAADSNAKFKYVKESDLGK